ncbi:MAG: FGGY-family carbohydrate kinase [Pseudomonadota bacterium]
MANPSEALFVGLDLGTSGARAVVINNDQETVSVGKALLVDHGSSHRDPSAWWSAAQAALDDALGSVERSCVRAISVDGTSGTMVAVDAAGTPLAEGIMYNDPCEDEDILDSIARHAPADTAARGASSALARALRLQPLKPYKILHQADWIANRLSGLFFSDDNNALKTGFDPRIGDWPSWIADNGQDLDLLPDVHAPGSVVGNINTGAASQFGLTADVAVVAGTTDGCASFLATGTNQPGEAVSALGTTLTLKILSEKPIFAPQYGIYSHKLLGMWLAGGASNSGGNALAQFFSGEQIEALSGAIDPESETGLDYYPLSKPGERFPISDPDLPPKMSPRPNDDVAFLHALLEGIAGVEALGYARLKELGAGELVRVRSVGGGAANNVWTRIRARKLDVPMDKPQSAEAAFGTALLAHRGWMNSR